MNKKQKKLLYNLIILALIATGIGYVCSRFVRFGRVEFTDDAQVRRQLTPVQSRVQGFVREVRFSDFQPVHKGDTLALIEDTEYRLRLAQAEAEYATAVAGHGASSTSVSTAANNIRVSSAGMEEVSVQLENARRELERYRNLLEQKAVTRQQYDNVETAFRALQARHEQASRLKQTSSLVHNEQADRLSQSEAALRLAKAQVELAQLNLSYTAILAPCDGCTGRREVLEGQLVQPGQIIANIVSAEDVWVVANYRETQLRHIKEGYEADIEVDAIGGITFRGRVERLSDGTEAAYSLLPASNAAGNFVKVEQRVPVRIRFTDDNPQEEMAKLRSGLNVECTIRY